MTQREERPPEFCHYCGYRIRTMCQLGTGFCSAQCKEDFEERGHCRGDGEANCFCQEDE